MSVNVWYHSIYAWVYVCAYLCSTTGYLPLHKYLHSMITTIRGYSTGDYFTGGYSTHDDDMQASLMNVVTC